MGKLEIGNPYYSWFLWLQGKCKLDCSDVEIMCELLDVRMLPELQFLKSTKNPYEVTVSYSVDIHNQKTAEDILKDTRKISSVLHEAEIKVMEWMVDRLQQEIRINKGNRKYG